VTGRGTSIVVFTRDLRVHDNPALAAACDQPGPVVPVFVADPALIAMSANRTAFLRDCVAELRSGLRERGGDLLVRHGNPAGEILRLATETGARRIFIADDVSHYATRRRDRIARECGRQRLELTITPGPAVVPPGELCPASGTHYRVFTPYWRAWAAARWRQVVPAPRTVRLPPGLRMGRIFPNGHGASPHRAPGGEGVARQRAERWLRGSLGGYPGRHDDLAADDTSRLSAYLRFGCLSAVELARRAQGSPGGDEYCRQLAWRDFFYQVTAAFPDMARQDYRPRGARWHRDAEALDAWREGRTGVPIVDAGLRQLAAEGFMHNRARLITASFLTRSLRIDWRDGYRHFGRLLTDADVANNAGNWQWVAGTGNSTRPGQVLNPLRQGRRFDPAGDYVRRYVPELAGVDSALVHTPWHLPPARRRQLAYPPPIIDLP
jgi:deoxyribodipyrimidine photo-lyase